ncbi:hypothetical protein AhaeINNSZ174_06700 [Acinetobacter haemolyticus]|uniref:hypothetical protein n=1 Tax=Acinetobacter haemolyticus TaxID=29430 RepID=UPI000E15FFFF|nr:hypothetical protein [Acinetobacter haemolyticus]QHI29172.1 hypothetical protein AhaeINNSZ174_06700 [Acinetobacter haemolyticus]WPO66389.1 hypothetical protein SDC64_10640 [Acinetobacter haemolyticus]SUU22793.1 Uncharacterised protein [Acinetobacter haemolyticus]
MAYVCEVLQIVDNVQTCVQWTEYSFLQSLAITRSQMTVIAKEIGSICAILIAYTLIAKAVKLA